MRERGISFGAPMVRAVLSDQKMQTRRLWKMPRNHEWVDIDSGLVRWSGGNDYHVSEFACPYGVVGDRLWVREAWRVRYESDAIKPRDLKPGIPVIYEASRTCGGVVGRFRHSMFMPRWASRILLEIVSVRVERLRLISEADAIAEGVEGAFVGGGRYWRNYLLSDADAQCSPMLNFPSESFRSLWEFINGGGSWDKNPWVWVVEFKRITEAA